MLRVRGLTMDDAHLFRREDQSEHEIFQLLDIVELVLGKTFGLSYRLDLATRPDKKLGSDATWSQAERALEQALKHRGATYRIDQGGGAFYGPKIDIKFNDAIGREWQGATIQLDFEQPERFKLEYTGEDNRPHRPVMIHRAIYGTLERFVGFLIEHFAGAFPLWLAPEQVRVLPISDAQAPAARALHERLRAAGIRSHLDERNETLNYRIRDGELQKVPYMAVVGQREADAGSAAVRGRGEGKKQGGVGQAPGRQAAIHGGLPGTVPALTINKVCGSGLKAVMLAAQAIRAGDEQCVVAGGMESMSNAPHYVYGMRGGIKAGDSQLVDGMIHDGLWDSFSDAHMGALAEYTAKKAGVSREDQDRFALASHQKTVAAMEACRFKAETVPVEIPGKKGPTLIEKDESPRKDSSLEALAALKPSFEKDGTVTPGNAPGLNDGASALVVTSLAFAKAHGVKPLAGITAYASAGGEPRDLFFAPIVAVQNLMAKAKMKIGDYDLIEANEAFAVQAIADGRALGWDWDRVNVNGGAIALGHPIGASGARILTTLLFALKDRKQTTGLATLCLGGGNAVALSVEML